MKKRSGFTLVEMLIVVVIIGILSAALIPRLKHYMAKTRDLKRHADLRNIAAAVEMYKNDYGELPGAGILEKNIPSIPFSYRFDHIDRLNGFYTNRLTSFLSGYINSIPKDSKKQNRNNLCIMSHQSHCKSIAENNSYLYLLKLERPEISPLNKGKLIATLAAKVETEEAANFVFLPHDKQKFNNNGYPIDYDKFFHGFSWRIWMSKNQNFPARAGPKLEVCSAVIKGDEAEWKQQENGTYTCTYTDNDQLFYVIKIE